ncbi:MAG: trypsin-like peptidase domain-containing protein [Bacteroidales bacterium]|nr:trypsin-like peptidase domain-containing protein [Bacteroidales bacterium]
MVQCAHKSGHRRDWERPGTAMVDRPNGKSARASSRKSKIVNKRSSDKLEGSQIFDRYGSAVFMVFTSDGLNAYQGSGFFIDNDGLAVSNYHVFKGTGIGLEQIKLVDSDVAYKVTEVIARSEDEDFILFRVDCENTNYIPIATDKPKIGEKVYAIGSPRGLENTFSSGEVSQWRADYLMQVSALIDHGSSGGALINEYGEVVGITSGSFADGSQANLNYAWSIDAVKPYIKLLLSAKIQMSI